MQTDIDTDRRETFLRNVALFMLALMAVLFGHARTILHAVADGMMPEVARGRYEAADDAERAAAMEAAGQMPELVRAEEPTAARREPTLGDLIQRHARQRLHQAARPLDGHELGTLGLDVQAWMYGLTDAECRALAQARPSAVTMYVTGQASVAGVRSVADGSRDAAARRATHVLRLADPDHDWTPVAPAYA